MRLRDFYSHIQLGINTGQGLEGGCILVGEHSEKKSLSLGSYTLKMSQQCHAFANQANGNSAQATKINTGMGTSLAVQQLRRHGSNVGDVGLIPGWGTKSPHPIWYKQNTINNRTARGERRGEKDMEKIGSSCPWHEHGTLFPYSSVGQESACSAGDPGSIPGLGRSPGEGNSNPLQYSCLENPMDGGAWQTTVHGVAKVGHILVTNPPPPPCS